jgi:hypothetical protein
MEHDQIRPFHWAITQALRRLFAPSHFAMQKLSTPSLARREIRANYCLWSFFFHRHKISCELRQFVLRKLEWVPGKYSTAPYSQRSDFMGSIRTARRAGTKHAALATSIRMNATLA